VYLNRLSKSHAVFSPTTTSERERERLLPAATPPATPATTPAGAAASALAAISYAPQGGGGGGGAGEGGGPAGPVNGKEAAETYDTSSVSSMRRSLLLLVCFGERKIFISFPPSLFFCLLMTRPLFILFDAAVSLLLLVCVRAREGAVRSVRCVFIGSSRPHIYSSRNFKGRCASKTCEP
jgi:hypothetical protein